METPSKPNNPKAIPYRPRRSMLNWVDFLVILATMLVFGAVVLANKPHARTQSGASSSLITDLPQDISQAPDEAGLIRAKIRLAQGAPWS